MATLTSDWQDIGSTTVSPSGYPVTFRITLQAKYVNQSGTSAQVCSRAIITNISSVGWNSSNNAYAFDFGGASSGDVGWGPLAAGASITSSELTSGSFGGGSTVSGAIWIRSINDSSYQALSATMPTFSVAPNDLTISVRSKTYNSATFDVSISSYGDPSSASGRYISAIMYHKDLDSYTGRYHIETKAWETLSAIVTVNDSSDESWSGDTDWKIVPLTGNTQYSYGAYATNTQTDSRSYYKGAIYLPCPPMGSITEQGTSAQTYNKYNLVNAQIDWVRNTTNDGGAESRTGYYRYSTDNGTTYSDWTAWGSADSGSGTFIAVIPTSSTVLLEAKLNTPNGGDSESITTTFTTLPTHTLDFSNFTYKDINSDVVNVTEDDQVLVQNQSTLQVTIPYADRARITDGVSATIQDYTSTINSNSITIPYSSTADTSGTFPLSAISSSGTKSISVVASDSLEATKSVSKSVEIVPWIVPTISASFTRIDVQGHIKLQVEGTFSPVEVNGEAKNDIGLYYILDDGEPVIFEGTVDYENGTFYGETEIDEITYSSIAYITAYVVDFFDDAYSEIIVSIAEQERYMKSARYDVEFWNWKNNTFEMDVSHIIDGDLNIEWTLDDIEEVNFMLDLVQFEKQCELLGVDPRDMLEPYVHDIRIKRNGKYVVGCQLVEANINLTSQTDPKIQVRGTGYLNLFKDQYISEPMAGYTYPEMAHKLLNRAQHADILVKNPTGDIDTSYWLARHGTLSVDSNSVAGANCIRCLASANIGWTCFGTVVHCPAGTPVHYDFWVKGWGGGYFFLRQSPYIAYDDGTQRDILVENLDGHETWTHFSGDYTTRWDNEYIIFEQNQSGITSLWVDNVFVYRTDDEDRYHDLNVGTIYGGLDDTEDGTGHNYATTDYTSDRQYDYQLQNVKDAVMDLVALEDDNFDFEFTYDRKFNTYDQKGTIKTDLTLDYPGNIESLDIRQSAVELANKIQNIGSGIGDERLETWSYDNTSRLKYGNRESIVTNSNVSIMETLIAQAEGLVADSKDVTRELSVQVNDGSINCGNIETGDILAFRIGNQLLSSGYSIIGAMGAWYRVKGLKQTFTQDGVEQTQLTLDLYEKFEPES